jgi:predicted phosphodiesterase
MISKRNGWSQEQDARLRELHEAGASAAAIADALSDEFPGDFTGDMVSSRARRLNLHKVDGTKLFASPRKFERVQVDKAKDGTRLMVLNDTQFPFHDAETLAVVERFMADFEPDHLVLAGDIFDHYELSDFDKDPSRRFSLQDELDIGNRYLRRWEDLCRNASLYFIEGNHEDRRRKWLWRHGAMSSLRSLEPEELMETKDRWTHLSYGSQIDFLGILIEHGRRVLKHAGATARMMLLERGSSGIVGHTHRFAVVCNRDARDQYVYVENGCLCRLDPEYMAIPDWQHAFTYGIVYRGRVHLMPVRVWPGGFRAEGRNYRRNG